MIPLIIYVDNDKQNVPFYRKRRKRLNDHRVRQRHRHPVALYRRRRHHCVRQALPRGWHNADAVPTDRGHAVRVQELVPRARSVPKAEAGRALGADDQELGCGVLRAAGEYCLRYII